MLVKKHGSKENFLTEFNPDLQKSICGKIDDCYFGDYPTLSMLKEGYGENTPVVWLLPQLYNLSEYCGCREKLKGASLEDCANVIAIEFNFLKVSELMLFFHRFKSGYYDRFYGSVDPLIITKSLHKFLSERAAAYAEFEKELERKKYEEWKKTAITWEEYCQLVEAKLRAKGNDIEADMWVNRKFMDFCRKEIPSNQPETETIPKFSKEVADLAKSLLNDPMADKSNKVHYDKMFKKKYGYTLQEYIDKYNSSQK